MEVVLLVEPAAAATALLEVEVASAAATTATAEEVGEDVVEVHVLEVLVVAAATAALALLVLAHALFALLVVDAALVFVAERLVGVRDLLELVLGRLGVVLVAVGVVLDGEFLERLLDLLLRSVLLDTEQLVVVFARLAALLLALLPAAVGRCETRRSLVGLPTGGQHDEGEGQQESESSSCYHCAFRVLFCFN